MRTTDVIVGVDGSAPSWEALRWAVAEAGRRTARLRIIAAYRAPWPGEEIAAGADLVGAALAGTESVVAEMMAFARQEQPGIAVNGLAVCGGAVPVLHAAAVNAALLVVGSRGHGGFASLLLGATGLQAATHAPVPVVVVRGRTDASTGPIVVGTDGSPGADHAVAMAFEEAALRGCDLVAVRAYHVPTPPWGRDVEPTVYDPDRRRAAAHAALDESITAWREKYPQVEVQTVVTPDDPAEVLIGTSHGAQLLVVGTRGHGGFAGLLLGSVGQKLLYHSHCPVLIARPVNGG
jgi:nucleotide-binding universal stress UspA family protein